MKIEQIYCLRSVSDQLMKCAHDININMGDNDVMFKNIKKNLKDFMDNTEGNSH